ncbi:MAG: hypothetical protein ACI9WU_003373 [Myxococcota bacterium]|jgi:hypothetical protein
MVVDDGLDLGDLAGAILPFLDVSYRGGVHDRVDLSVTLSSLGSVTLDWSQWPWTP